MSHTTGITLWVGPYTCPEEVVTGGDESLLSKAERSRLTSAKPRSFAPMSAVSPAATDATRLVADFVHSGEGARWTLHREPWALLGLAPDDSLRVAIQEQQSGSGWVTVGSGVADGRMGLAEPSRATRFVLPPGSSLEQVAANASGRNLSEVTHSRLGSLDPSEESIPASLETGDSLRFTYGATAPGEHPGECAIVVTGATQSGAGLMSERANTSAPRLQFALQQNQPNPFSGETRIGFVLPSPEQVRVDLYDLVGRRIHTLVDARFAPGEHVLVWNGQFGAGHQAAPGVYWYRLTTPTHRAQRRMILLP